MHRHRRFRCAIAAAAGRAAPLTIWAVAEVVIHAARDATYPPWVSLVGLQPVAMETQPLLCSSPPYSDCPSARTQFCSPSVAARMGGRS
jgi:hypothetical protein